jgi:hypothetical protein
MRLHKEFKKKPRMNRAENGSAPNRIHYTNSWTDQQRPVDIQSKKKKKNDSSNVNESIASAPKAQKMPQIKMTQITQKRNIMNALPAPKAQKMPQIKMTQITQKRNIMNARKC